MQLAFKVDTKIRGMLFTDINRVHSAFNTEFKRALYESVSLLKFETSLRTPVNTGILRKSINTEVKGVNLDLEGKVGTPLGYALPVEMGAKPHFPPIEKIELWAQRRQLAWERNGVQMGIKRIAFLISRSISRRGFAPVEMFSNAFDNSKGRIVEILKRAQVKVLEAIK